MSGSVGNPPKAVRSVQWAPNLERHFVQWSHAPGGKAAGSDLTLYECSEKSTGLSICKPTIRAINKDFESVLVTCFRWSPSSSSPYHFAAGVSTGQVVISSFQTIAGAVALPPDGSPLAAKPTILVKGGSNQRAITQRRCKCISWNSVQENLLVAGLEVLTRARSDPCVQVWDLLHNPSIEPTDPPADSDSAMADPPISSFNVLSNPHQGYVKDETCNAVEWVPGSASSFAAGFQKGLRVIDIRENKNQGIVAVAKTGVVLLAFDPGCENRLATFSGERDDTSIKIWDVRSLNTHIMQVQASGTPKRIQWCPGVDGVLSAVVAGGGEEGTLQLWGVRSNDEHKECYTSQVAEDAKTQAAKPDVKGRSATAGQTPSDALWARRVETAEDIASFDWHPAQGGRVLTVSSEDSMRDIKIAFSSALSFGPHGALLFAADATLSQSSIDPAEGAKEDVAEMMRQRALKGYVLDPAVNIEICRTMGDQSLARVWQIVQRLQQGKEDVPGGDQPKERVSGLADLLGSTLSTKVMKPLLPMLHRAMSRDRLRSQQGGPPDTPSSAASKQRRSSLPDEPGKELEGDSMVMEVFVSDPRRHALKVCDFDFGVGNDDDQDYAGSEALEKKVTSMERKGQYDQAAFIRLLQVDLSSSLECLYKGASHNPDRGGMFAMAAVALAGAAGQALPVWRRAYQHMMEVCRDQPYLRACFLVLNKDLDGVMKEEGIALMDRVAFACRYMPDAHLSAAFRQLLASKVKQGQLDAILLLGLGPPSIPLLENYVAKTCDLQTAALLLCFFSRPPTPPTPGSNPRRASQAVGMATWEVWLDEYREFLDRLQLWEQRAVLDIALAPALRPAPPAEVHVVCTSCSAPVTLALKCGEQSKSEVKSGPSQCKVCNQELPRCCLCLMPMGCDNAPSTSDVPLPALLSVLPTEHASGSSDGVVRPLYSRSHFDSWFAWCQMCHHGGHVGHLQHWFANNSICPVTGCKCVCLYQDSYLPRTSTIGAKPAR